MKLVNAVGLMILSVLLLSSPVCAEYFLNDTVALDAYPDTQWSIVGEHGAVKLIGGSSALYTTCTPQSSGTIAGMWILEYDSSDYGNATWVEKHNPCPPTDYFALTQIIGGGTWCNGGIQCYDTNIVVSWESLDIPPVTPACSFTATPNVGASPLSVVFNDTSASPANHIMWQWLVVENTTATTVATSTLKTWTATLNGDNLAFDVYFNAANSTANCLKFEPEMIHTTLSQSQNNTQRLIIEPTDAASNALVTGAHLSVLNIGSNLWTNLTAIWGTQDFYAQYGANLYIEGTAPGYQKSTKNWTVLPYGSYILKIPMFATGTIAASNVTLNVVVLDGATSGVFPNAQVRLSDGQVKTTSGAGVASFNVSATKSYQIVASYTGYQSATRTLTTGAGGTSQDTYLTLNRIVVTTAPTLPPGVTAVVTLDTRTNAQKDQAMMDQIRDYANILIPVACLMTLLYMFGYKP